MLRKQSLVVLLLITLLMRTRAFALPPAQMLPSEVASREEEKDLRGGAYPGLLLIGRGDEITRDEKYSQPYHAIVTVYVGDTTPGSPNSTPTLYARRFLVHAPDREVLPLARRVARLLLIAYQQNRQRLRHEHPYNETVDVWLTRQNATGDAASAGGEQFRNQIYLYNVLTERKPIEWVREVCHEYGHYALPGLSGYTAPEAWANGILGERLFLKWLGDDVRTGRIAPDDLPFVTPAELDDYTARQIAPLIRRIARDGVDARLIARKDAVGMDASHALALYLDAVYGSPQLLSAWAYTSPPSGSPFAQGPDFLHGSLDALRGATEFALHPIRTGSGVQSGSLTDLLVYLPGGDWIVTPEAGLRSWSFAADAKGLVLRGKTGLFVSSGAWRKIHFTLTPAATQTETPRLLFRKRDADSSR